MKCILFMCIQQSLVDRQSVWQTKICCVNYVKPHVGDKKDTLVKQQKTICIWNFNKVQNNKNCQLL